MGLGKNYSAALSFKGAARRLGGLRGTLRRLGPPVGRDATELARSAICRAGPLTSRGTRPPIVHDRIQDHHHPRTTTTKCGGSIAQHDRVPSTDRLNGDVPDVRPLVCVCAATRLRHTGRGSARDLLFSPTRPPRKDRHTRGYKEAELGGRRGCARDGRDATFIRYSDATTCPRVDGSDAVGARSLSNLQGPQDDEGEERGGGTGTATGGGASSIRFKPAHTGSLSRLSLDLGRLWVLAKTIARL